MTRSRADGSSELARCHSGRLPERAREMTSIAEPCLSRDARRRQIRLQQHLGAQAAAALARTWSSHATTLMKDPRR